jgi:hypothetical protein
MINATIYQKLLAQAAEAKERGMVKLASGILGAIGACPSEGLEQYSYAQLQQDVYGDIWKIAAKLLRYYDLKSVDAGKLDDALVAYADELMDGLEQTLGVEGVIKSELEPKIPGEK